MAMSSGWQQLIPPSDFFRGEGRYPIEAYSEFMPPPRLGWKPYAAEPSFPQLFDADDPLGWRVSEYEEDRELQHPNVIPVNQRYTSSPSAA